jgi:hypothetical protein
VLLLCYGSDNADDGIAEDAKGINILFGVAFELDSGIRESAQMGECLVGAFTSKPIQ